MKVLGLDLSLTSTGWSTGDVSGNLTSQYKGVERLDDLADQLIFLLETEVPNSIVIENYSFGSKNSQAHAIGEWGGVARLTIWSLGFPFIEVPPTCRAKFATGKGNASKGEVMSAVSARTGIVWSGKGAEDQCDAWILAEMGRCHFGLSKIEWPALNLSALDKIEWTATSRKN